VFQHRSRRRDPVGLSRRNPWGDLVRAIGDYHSHTPMLNQAYQVQVMRSASGYS